MFQSCHALKQSNTVFFQIDIDTFGQVNMMYSCIAVLRALALKNGPQKIFQEYTQFESHLNERMKTEIYNKVRNRPSTMADIPLDAKRYQLERQRRNGSGGGLWGQRTRVRSQLNPNGFSPLGFKVVRWRQT